jgi:hypothetical protein
MIEPLFVSVPPVWTGQTPWAGSWYQPPASVPPVVMPQNAAPPGGIASTASLAGSAPMLVAAVALRRGQPQGPTTDQEVEEVIYDTLELFSGASEVEVRCEAGRVTLSGTVSHKRLKRDIGEIAWSIPTLSDVVNNITIAPRRRTRSFAREGDPVASPAATRKQA